MCTSTWKGLKNCTCQNSLFYTMVKGKGARYHCIRTPSWIWDRSKKASQASQGFSVHHIALKTSIPVLMKNQKLHFSLDVYFVPIVGKMVDQFFHWILSLVVATGRCVKILLGSENLPQVRGSKQSSPHLQRG